MLSQWSTEMTHVAGIVGGFNSQEKVVGQEGRIFNLIPKEQQQAAVKFLLDNAFTTPDVDDRRGDSAAHRTGGRDRPHSHRAEPGADQSAEQRALRAADGSRRRWTATWPIRRWSSWPRVRKGIWKELDAPQVKMDAYRRELQRSYLQAVNIKLNPAAAAAATPCSGAMPEGT